MYNLTIHFGPNAVAWSFLFKDENKAQSAFTNVSSVMGPSQLTTDFEDDYGQKVTIFGQAIHGVLLENTELGTEARILRGLEQAKGQARATKRASSDPELQAAMRGQGPSVITPFANGGFRQ
jgi:hypothetical protein